MHVGRDDLIHKMFRFYFYITCKKVVVIIGLVMYWSVSAVVCLQYLSQANDIEMMLREKNRQVSSDDYGRDEDAADKLLTKHKVSYLYRHPLQTYLLLFPGFSGHIGSQVWLQIFLPHIALSIP